MMTFYNIPSATTTRSCRRPSTTSTMVVFSSCSRCILMMVILLLAIIAFSTTQHVQAFELIKMLETDETQSSANEQQRHKESSDSDLGENMIVTMVTDQDREKEIAEAFKKLALCVATVTVKREIHDQISRTIFGGFSHSFTYKAFVVESVGTALLWDQRGHLVMNYHSIKEKQEKDEDHGRTNPISFLWGRFKAHPRMSKTILVKLPGMGDNYWEATVVGFDEKKDLVVLRLGEDAIQWMDDTAKTEEGSRCRPVMESTSGKLSGVQKGEIESFLSDAIPAEVVETTVNSIIEENSILSLEEEYN